MTIRFQFAADKGAAAIQRLVREHPRIDLHAALKTFYFADKAHLNEHYRPIFGARYRAMKYGPVPLEVYEMMKGEGYYLAELGVDGYPWFLDGYKLIPSGENAPTFAEDVLSETELAHLDAAVATSLGMTFNQRTAATHGPDWQNARLGSMAYADMIEESPQKEELVNYLSETSRRLRL